MLNNNFVRNIGRGELKSQKHLEIMEEMNKKCVVFGGKTYESFRWVRRFYSIIRWANFTPVQKLAPSLLEKICRDLFKFGKNPNKKLVYTTREHWETLKIEDKRKVATISMSKNNYILSNIDGAKFYVVENLHHRRKNFSKRIKGEKGGLKPCLR